MKKRICYSAPCLDVWELKPKGVICTSDSNAQIEQLNEKYDWSDIWNN